MGGWRGPAKEVEVCRTPISEYEQSRDERIRQNLEKMKKLGILELSVCLKPHRRLSTLKKTPSSSISPSHSFSEPTRRSSRLKNRPAMTCPELEMSTKNKKKDNDEDILVEMGSREEIYSEKHVKLLGSTAKTWTLFIDGCGADGKRIYDPFRGKTCHQCRQKTLGCRTRCSDCHMVQGQFCGDCLYMRYGEHVDEANENPNWVCPVCRGICNCSLCRNAKGWAPTGPLYKKITQLGFKSVAHYLIQTRRWQPDPVINDCADGSSVKRSLAFSDKDDQHQCSPNKPVLPLEGLATPKQTCSLAAEITVNSVEPPVKGVFPDGNAPLKATPKPDKTKNFEPSSESIGARLRKRRNSQAEEGGGIHINTPLKTTAPKRRLLSSPAKPSPELALIAVPSSFDDSIVTEASSNSIGGRLRLRRRVMIGGE